MKKTEIRRVVLNMINIQNRDEAELEISDVTKWPTDFADYSADVVIIGVDPSVELMNTRWHESEGYYIEFNSSGGSGKDRKEELVIEKNNIKTYLKIIFNE